MITKQRENCIESLRAALGDTNQPQWRAGKVTQWGSKKASPPVWTHGQSALGVPLCGAPRPAPW